MKTVVLMLIFGLILATNAFALTGTFTFTDTVSSPAAPTVGTTWTWTHTLKNTDFKPLLIGDIDKIISAKLALNFTFIPAQTGNCTNYQLHLKTDLDDIKLIGTYNDTFYDSGEKTRDWEIIIKNGNALNAISDKSASIFLIAKKGEIDQVNSSTLSGTGIGNVAPEPVSMVFVGAGFVALPFLRKMRGKIKSTLHRC